MGAVLCGGASRRMGRDKSLVEVEGVAMALRVAAVLRAAGCHPVRAVGGDRPALDALGLDPIDDLYPGEGPVGGVITALENLPGPAWGVMVVACDLAYLTDTTARAVISAAGDVDVAVAVTDRTQPMCAVWRPSALQPLVEAFAAGERRLVNVIAGLRIVEVSVNPQDLTNVNAPSDLRQ